MTILLNILLVSTAYPSETEIKVLMRRGLFSINVNINQTDLCIGTVHLESMLDDTQKRIGQISLIEQHHSECENLILLGDFNFGDFDPENNSIPAGYIDIWKRLRPKEAGYTLDKRKNPYSKTNSFVGEKADV